MYVTKHPCACYHGSLADACLQATWDGHSGSIPRTNAVMGALSISEQIEAIHRAKGLKYVAELHAVVMLCAMCYY
jgi:hypothetical protein